MPNAQVIVVTSPELQAVAALDPEPDETVVVLSGGAAAPATQGFPGFSPTEAVDEDRDNWGIYVDLESYVTDQLLLGGALRYEDYSDFGNTTTGKLSAMYNFNDRWALRGTVSTGFRAPGIGELFGGAAREDFTFLDPCADVLGLIGSAGGGRDTPQPQNIIDNCATLGVPVD